ncbi:hypothetical protein [Streptomyces sp. SP18CS02]|uniref:hypothetical protein n=1 Tax=Streptomyces sp. SP18CS02 TaxID=3002531 RepID=UPI002E789F92|nr:hypothetical protein [Streptomyces sp. SP18CS02]MEE1753952.1 hypothetical protein [Streptomyces sp. SP18CS02]
MGGAVRMFVVLVVAVGGVWAAVAFFAGEGESPREREGRMAAEAGAASGAALRDEALSSGASPADAVPNVERCAAEWKASQPAGLDATVRMEFITACVGVPVRR